MVADSKFITSLTLTGALLAGQAAAAPSDSDQSRSSAPDHVVTHQVGGQVPLVVRDGRIVPEDGSVAEMAERVTGAVPSSITLQRLTDHFQSKARSVPVLPAASVAQDAKTFFMIDPYQLSQGLPYDARQNDYAKWASVKTMIEAAGGHVVTVRGADAQGGTRETFTRDAYVMIEGHAFIPDADAYAALRSPDGLKGIAPDMVESARRVVQQAEAMLKESGVPVHKVTGAWFEGGNVIPDLRSKTIFMGLETDRDNKHSVVLLTDAVNKVLHGGKTRYEPMGIPLVNQEIYYHLDLGMSEPLPLGGEFLLSPHVTDTHTYGKIVQRVGAARIVTISEDEPVGATNFVTPTPSTIVMTNGSKELVDTLSSRGYRVFDPRYIGQYDMTMAAGGVHCMANEIPAYASRAPVFKK